MTEQTLKGIITAVVTPLAEDGTCDTAKLAEHCVSLLENGVHGISLFGTTGEGPSFTCGEREAALEAVLKAGVPSAKMLPGTGCASLEDTVRLTRHALAHDCANVLVMPPFFFKGVGDQGVYRVYAELIERINDPKLRVYIYNFPAVTGVWIKPVVISQLREKFGKTIAGVKDSSGDWAYVTTLIRDHPGLAVFSGWEPLLPQLLAAGGAGNVCGIANIAPRLMRRLYDERPLDPTAPLAATIGKIVSTVTALPVTPAIKAMVAHAQNDPNWRAVRAPLEALTAKQQSDLAAAVDTITAKKG